MQLTPSGPFLTSLLRRAVAPLTMVAYRGTLRSRRRGDRGDVPGWVLVTLMTAGLVTVLWVLARERLTQVFETAISSVTG